MSDGKKSGNNNQFVQDKKTIIDNLDSCEDNKEVFWKTPSSTRIVQGGSIMMALDIVCSLFFTFYMMTVARIPKEEGALLAIIDTLALMMKFLSVLGFTGVGSKMVAEYLVRDLDEARIYGISACKYNFFLTGLPLIVITTMMAIFYPKNELEQFAYITLVVITIFDRLESNFYIYILAYKRYDLYAYAYYIPWGAGYIFAIIVYPFFGVMGILTAFMLARVAQFICSIIAYKKCSDFPIKDIFSWTKEYGLFWKMFNFNFLYSLANLIFSLVTTTMLITFGAQLSILTEQEVVGLYTISTLSNLLINVFEIVVPIMVSISEGHSLKNPKLINNYTMLCVKFPILMSIAIFTFYVIFAVEVIELFFGSKYIPMGIVIVVCLMPSYICGAFASRYDNIIAGIGRPEVVILPWILVFVSSIIGMLIAMLLPDVYLYDYLVLDDAVLTNYGITLRFTFTLAFTSISLIIGGIWITKICLKVLGVKIPKSYFLKPVFTAVLVAAILVPIIRILPLKDFFVDLGGELGGYVYIMLTAVVGILLFLTFGILFDVMNREDGRFWKKIIEGFGPLAKIFGKPLFFFGNFLLNHQIKKFVSEPIHWVTQTDKKKLEQEQLFKVAVQPLSCGEQSRIQVTDESSKKGAPVLPGHSYPFKIVIQDAQQPLFDIIVYAKVGMEKIPESLSHFQRMEKNQNIDFDLMVNIPRDGMVGLKELQIIIEAYEVSKPGITKEKLLKKGLWTYFDYRIRWVHEEDFYINILTPDEK